MNRKQNAKLASWAAVITAVLVLFALFYMFRREGNDPRIILPPDPNELSEVNTPAEEIASSGALNLELVEITRENAAALIAAMPRPAAYSSAGSTVVYGGDMSREWTHRLYTLDDYQLIERYEDGDLLDRVIYTPDKVYMWLNEQVQEIARGFFSADAAGRMPTYEDILDIAPDDITGAEYMRETEAPGVWIKASIMSADVEYWIDLESGMLTRAAAARNGVPIWEFTLLELTLQRPDDEVFLLPSGAYVWE
ncbi:MAG: hypothetical protein FWH16_01225 [Oscillospiraceae bacterium]|nr:hypothetical protein [Oscillospiraceae bacterium]